MRHESAASPGTAGKTETRRRAYIGLDIGASSIKGVRIEAGGWVSSPVVRPTPVGEGPNAVLAAVDTVVSELVAPGPVDSVGVGTPGAVDATGRVAAEVVNMPGWRGTDLRSAASASASAPAVVRNDSNLAAYAEWAVRGGSSQALLFVGIGTGIGGGFVEDGRMLSGVDDKAVEIGHVVITPGGRLCTCKRRGCVEAYASGLSIAKLGSELADERDGDLAAAIRAAGGRTSSARSTLLLRLATPSR